MITVKKISAYFNEVWKDIPGFEGKYQVSNYGMVKSINYHRGKKSRILKQSLRIDGYFQVVLCKSGNLYYRLVHRLVAEAFIPNPENLPVINHKDENSTNNYVCNLEWCTQQHNVNYGTGLKRALETRKTKSTRTAPREIIQLSLDGKLLKNGVAQLRLQKTAI